MSFVLAKEKPGTPDGRVYLTDVTLVETAGLRVDADAKVSLFVDEAFRFPDIYQAERWSFLILPEGFRPFGVVEEVALDDVPGLAREESE